MTDRINSHFNITLDICDSPGVIIGKYKCEVRNRLGHDHDYKLYTVQGVPMIDTTLVSTFPF